MVDKKDIEGLIFKLLKALGENPLREGLKETPKRVANMYEEMFNQSEADEHELIKIFNEEEISPSGLVEVRDIPFCSLCEHHLLPFKGVVHIKYIPQNGKILGISKFARIVNYFASGLQVQERITNKIAKFIFSGLSPKWVEVTVEAEHLCMTVRGVKAQGALTKTVATCGSLALKSKENEEYECF